MRLICLADMSKAPRGQPIYVSIKEAAHLSGISVRQMYTLMKSAEAPPHVRRFGKYMLWRKGFVEWATQPVIGANGFLRPARGKVRRLAAPVASADAGDGSPTPP